MTSRIFFVPDASAQPASLRGARHAPLVAALDAYSKAVLASGPAAYYRLDDSGQSALDSSGHGLSGSVGSGVTENAASIVASTHATAMQFHGEQQELGIVGVPANAALTPARNISVETLLRFSSTPATFTVPLAYGTDAVFAPYDLYFSAGGFLNAQFNLTSGVLVVKAAAALQPSTTYHVAATFDGTTGRLYVNGNEVSAARTGSLKGYDASHGLAIGDDAGYSDPAFSGTLQAVAVYAKTLAASDVVAHYKASLGPAPGPSPTPVPKPTPTPTPIPQPSPTVSPGSAGADWLTFHRDTLRTGWNPNETTLTTANVNAATFGLQATLRVDGQVYAEPLVATRETVPAIGVHDLLIVATENDSVYAYDAQTGAAVWKRSFVDPAAHVIPVPASDTLCRNVAPTIGITSTPVVDRARDAVYVVAATDEGTGAATATHIRLHSISLANGAERASVDISGSSPFSGGGQFTFTPKWQMNRASLLETDGNVYVGFGSHCDFGANFVHGWLFAYNANSLAPAGNDFLTTADYTVKGTTLGSIWGAGFGPSADSEGYIYASTGNGTPYDGRHSYTQSVLKLSSTLGFPPVASFTPSTEDYENKTDADLGSGGVLLLPDQPGPVRHVAIAGGKTGISFVLNRDSLGGFTAGGPDRIPYEARTNSSIYGGPAYFEGSDGKPYLVICGGNDPVMAYHINVSPLSLSLASRSQGSIGSSEGGTIPVVSSNGTKAGTAIVWAISRPIDPRSPIMLYGYDAANLHRRLFAAATQPWNNPEGDPLLTPTATDGKVYVPTGTAVNIFGLK